MLAVEAVSKNQNVSICASSDGATCTGAWNQGWIVRLDGDGTVLRVWQGLSDGFGVSGGATHTFASTGELITGGDAPFVIDDPTDSDGGCACTQLASKQCGLGNHNQR